MALSRARVVGLGLCVVDHLYLVDRLDAADERMRYRERVVSTGGMAATAVAQAALLGCSAQLLSAVGDDAAGRDAVRSLRTAGVDTRRIVRSERVPTTVAVVLVERGTGVRRFVVPERRRVERRAPDFDLQGIPRAGALLVDGHFAAQALRAARLAAAHGVPVVGDFNRPTRAALRLLPHVDHAIVPREFARAFAGSARDTLLRLRDEFSAQGIVTQGARGGVYLDGGRTRRFASPRVRVRDTTGAGDAFHGAFAAGIAQGLPFARNLVRAARCGARCTTAIGGLAALLQSSSGGASGSGRSASCASSR